MQLLPMASSPDGLISARYAVITETPGWEVLQGGCLGNFVVVNFAEGPWIFCGKFRGHSQKCCGVQGFAGSVELSHRCRSRCRGDPSATLCQ